MKAVIFNGALKGHMDLDRLSIYIEELLSKKGYEVESLKLNEKNIAACCGCFGCWIKTPGTCVINDYGREVSEKIINSDAVIYLTPVIFGGYSSEIKKVLDRSIPLILPFFTKIEGEIHHKERYKRYPKVVVLGMMENKDSEVEDIFNTLIKRNSLNIYKAFSGGVVAGNSDQDILRQIEEKLAVLEVKA